MEKIEVSSYPIYLGGIDRSLSEILDWIKPSSLFILTDENTHHHCLPKLNDILRHVRHTVFQISHGEKHKNIKTCSEIWTAMTEATLDRKATMINVGGGVIGDMGGFCASTYKRGISFIQVPTTLLSEVDASIGGKLGIDFEGYKNHIGVFNDPAAVLIDPSFLDTLSDRELRSGYAEIIKHSLIADGDDWKNLKQIHNLRNVDWTSVIRRSLEVKRKIVLEDPFEKNKRKLLNFGHTLGHAIESHHLDGDKPLLHGEAISAGMVFESKLSSQYLALKENELKDITDYIISLYGPPDPLDMQSLIPIMKQDKKNSAGKISFSLLKSIGDSQWDIMISEEELMTLSDFLSKPFNTK